jgi:hypothetical protein
VPVTVVPREEELGERDPLAINVGRVDLRPKTTPPHPPGTAVGAGNGAIPFQG